MAARKMPLAIDVGPKSYRSFANQIFSCSVLLNFRLNTRRRNTMAQCCEVPPRCRGTSRQGRSRKGQRAFSQRPAALSKRSPAQRAGSRQEPAAEVGKGGPHMCHLHDHGGNRRHHQHKQGPDNAKTTVIIPPSTEAVAPRGPRSWRTSVGSCRSAWVRAREANAEISG